jgi:hypothetical protein
MANNLASTLEVLQVEAMGAMSTPAMHTHPKTTTPVNAKSFSTKTRKKLAKTGKAEPDGSYPITDKKDVGNAVKDFHRSHGSPTDKAHIKKEAKKLGVGNPFSAHGLSQHDKCSCSHEGWMHSTSGKCNVIGCDCEQHNGGKKMKAGGPGSGRHSEEKEDKFQEGQRVHIRPGYYSNGDWSPKEPSTGKIVDKASASGVWTVNHAGRNKYFSESDLSSRPWKR